MLSQDTQNIPTMLAAQTDEGDNQAFNADTLADKQEEKVIHVYPVAGGGILFSPTELDQEQPQETIIESEEPALQPQVQTTKQREPRYVLQVALILFLFIGLDNVGTVLAQFAPTVTVAITPVVKTITTTSTFLIGPNNVQGRVLPALTASSSQTAQATGKGHQDARTASGTLTFYNGSFTAQTIDAGTVYTGADGVQVVTDQIITIAAANPPYVGEATVSASAILAGARGNIPAGDISITTPTLQVRNSQFQNGQDARDFVYVQRSDIQHASNALTTLLLQSEQGALSAQLKPGETLTTPQCSPRVFSNHTSGDEAAGVEVTVSETCKAAAYSQQSLQQAALQLVHGRLVHLTMRYQLIGPVQITIRATTIQQGSATVDATIHGVWVYQFDEGQIKTLVAGEPRLQAIRLLSSLPGVQRVSIAGISDNAPLPDEVSHIHLLIFIEE